MNSLYESKVDFEALARQDAEFRKFLSTKGQINFQDPNAVRQLTASLLHRDFGLDIDLPDDRLCPPVPNRFNYIRWIQDLIDCTSPEYHEGYDPNRDIAGLDIGTGASCIYPLLGVSGREKWRFVATDIDEKNLHYSRKNVSNNRLDSRIRIIDVTPQDSLIPLGTKIPLNSLDFTMCNPPFYESQDEMSKSAKEKQEPPLSACTGAPVEMVTPGGEVAFITRMIQDSCRLGEAVQWYSSMVGKRSSVFQIVEELHRVENKNWAVTEFIQGEKTRRWAIAWSWKDLKPTMAIARGISNIPKHYLPFPSEFIINQSYSSIDSLIKVINCELESLNILWKWNDKTSAGIGFAMNNAWSRHARRQRQQAIKTGGVNESGKGDFYRDQATFGFTIRVRRLSVERIDVHIRWVKGVDAVLFESFYGMLKRKLEESAEKEA
ncbi:hypothetical protein FQN57_003561 [Myotisia sp. PD_48]|nr:hypothetical protein FQN57_003561 [Myotisia sp. PD_48]